MSYGTEGYEVCRLGIRPELCHTIIAAASSLNEDNDKPLYFRHSLLLTYIKKGTSFNPGAKQKRVEIPLC